MKCNYTLHKNVKVYFTKYTISKIIHNKTPFTIRPDALETRKERRK
jgi:hypothetical protein